MTQPYRLRAARPVSEASATETLGPLVRTYYGAATRKVIWTASPFFLLIGYTVWLGHEGLLAHWFNSTFSVWAVGAIFGIAAILIVHTAAVGGGELLRVHTDGLLDLRTGPRAVRWDEMESLTPEEPGEGRTIETHLLRTTDGAVIALGPTIGSVHDLVDEVRVRMAERRLPAVRARIAEGETVGFGAFTASAQGIALGPRVVTWDEVQDVDAEGGEIVVHLTQGERLAARLSDVPNAFLLAEMAHDRKAR